MNTLFNKVNKFGVLAVLAASIFITTQSFKRQDPLYPKVGSTYQSTPLVLSEENEEGGWHCEGINGECSAEFATPPSATNQTPTGAINPGTYVND